MYEPQVWISQVTTILLDNLADVNLTNAQLAKQLAVSERLFYRRIKAITGKTPNQFIRDIRLKEAKRLLETAVGISVKEVATSVGYTKAIYFSELFKDKFGLKPSDIINK